MSGQGLRTLESLGGRVLDPGPFRFGQLPDASRADFDILLDLCLLTGLPLGDQAKMRREAQRELQFRLVVVPLRALRSYVMVPLSRYDEADAPGERVRTEALIQALRAGAELPPLVLVIPPHAAASAPIRLIDGYHRATAYGFLRIKMARAYELILPAGSALL
jgi:hypothetical protein